MNNKHELKNTIKQILAFDEGTEFSITLSDNLGLYIQVDRFDGYETLCFIELNEISENEGWRVLDCEYSDMNEESIGDTINQLLNA